jgi:VanZ family protein
MQPRRSPIPVQPPSLHLNQLYRPIFWLACLAVGALSLTPVQTLPHQVFDIWDKAQHAAGFAVLAFVGMLAYPRVLIGVTLGLLGYGAAIELAQSATGWRFGDIQDWLADAFGVFTALALRTSWRVLERRETDRDAQ